MFDLLVFSPVIVGTLMIAGILIELGLGKIGFFTKGLGLTFDREKNRYELSAGPIIAVFVIGASLVIGPLVIDYFLVSKRTFTVSGTVAIEDRADASGTQIISCYPLARVYPDGTFTSVRISKNELGGFPDLAFELKGYDMVSVNLMKYPLTKTGSHIELTEPVVLKRSNTGG